MKYILLLVAGNFTINLSDINMTQGIIFLISEILMSPNKHWETFNLF